MLFGGLAEAGYEVRYSQLPRDKKNLVPALNGSLRCVESNCRTIISTPSQIILIYLRILGKRNLILDAGWSLTESFLSNNSKWKFISRLKTYFLDFTAFQMADLVLLESPRQVAYVNKYFLVKRKKLIVSYTGINERNFESLHELVPYEMLNDKNNTEIILFRGKRNREAGLENISALTREKSLRGFKFLIISNKELNDLDWGPNVVLISRMIKLEEMKWCYKRSSITLGQMSSKSRVKNTIPHKTFESLYFGIPIVTSIFSSTYELLGDKGCLFWDSRAPLEFLAADISNFLKDKNRMQIMLNENAKFYRNELAQNAIIKELLCSLETSAS